MICYAGQAEGFNGKDFGAYYRGSGYWKRSNCILVSRDWVGFVKCTSQTFEGQPSDTGKNMTQIKQVRLQEGTGNSTTNKTSFWV